jgi:hypothetical protein
MVENILVLGTSKMDFVTEKGDAVKGTRVHYLIGAKSPNPDIKGFAPMRAWLAPDAAKNLDGVPGLYQAAFEIVPGQKSPELRLRSLSFIALVDLDPNSAS